ncbi:MAG: DNA-binding protein [Haliscomenobacteraceae bacterium CHB4]|nr:DNA-binding protein [Haliscomenobacteraceae bacterium CHB4]
MKTFRMFAWAAMFTILLPLTGTAQRGSGGWCTKNNYSRIFDPKTIVEVKGAVASVEKITPETGMSAGIHLMVKTEKSEQISVHLGPAWYLDNQEIQFAAGDAVVVKGSRVTYQNAPAIIAMTVGKGDQVLTLRDKKGNPGWNGWRQGKGGGRGRGRN